MIAWGILLRSPFADKVHWLIEAINGRDRVQHLWNRSPYLYPDGRADNHFRKGTHRLRLQTLQSNILHKIRAFM